MAKTPKRKPKTSGKTTAKPKVQRKRLTPNPRNATGKGGFVKGGRTHKYQSTRPKGYQDMVEYCREHTVEAINVIMEIMVDEHEKAGDRINAAKVLLDRGWGKAPQHILLATDKPEEKTLNDTRQRVMSLLTDLVDIQNQEDKTIDITPKTTP